MSIRFPDTRWSLIRRIGDRPEDAAIVVDLYCDGIVRYLHLRLGGQAGPADIDDIAQEVLLHLLEHPQVLAEARPGAGSRFRYFLMTVAFNAARNEIRSRRRDAAHAEPLPDEAAHTVTAAESPEPEFIRVMDRAWAQSVLTSAWKDLRALAAEGGLEPEALAVLEDSLLRGQGLRAIAEARRLSLPTCQRRFARAHLSAGGHRVASTPGWRASERCGRVRSMRAAPRHHAALNERGSASGVVRHGRALNDQR
ncbi:MAG: sigma-70 family RNA polymerase sigma factor [Planctomycetes bacterium]|nr:sigma-70 family RNA polymerase sigma factor [Planctomycetota bacterium]